MYIPTDAFSLHASGHHLFRRGPTPLAALILSSLSYHHHTRTHSATIEPSFPFYLFILPTLLSSLVLPPPFCFFSPFPPLSSPFRYVLHTTLQMLLTLFYFFPIPTPRLFDSTRVAPPSTSISLCFTFQIHHAFVVLPFAAERAFGGVLVARTAVMPIPGGYITGMNCRGCAECY